MIRHITAIADHFFSTRDKDPFFSQMSKQKHRCILRKNKFYLHKQRKMCIFANYFSLYFYDDYF